MARTTGLAAIPRETTATQVARQVRSAILSGRLPNGTQLREQALAAELGVSRGPLREALQRLVQEGLAIAEPHRGVFVAQLAEQELGDVFVARLAVEQTAAAVIASRRDDGDGRGIAQLQSLVQRLREAAATGKWAQVVDADTRFHQTLVEMSRSARLQRGFSTLSAETRIGIARQSPHYAQSLSIVAEHEEIVRALELGSLEEVREAIRQHMVVSVRNLGLVNDVPPFLRRDDGST